MSAQILLFPSFSFHQTLLQSIFPDVTCSLLAAVLAPDVSFAIHGDSEIVDTNA